MPEPLFLALPLLAAVALVVGWCWASLRWREQIQRLWRRLKDVTVEETL